MLIITMAGDNTDTMPTLMLSREEYDLPPWQQMVNNGAICSNEVNIIEPVVCTSDLDGAEGLVHCFSDEESESEDEEGVKKLELREYQKELAESALSGHNCIICAPTGSGKTKVSIHIILEHLKTNPSAKVAFFARSVPLAKQQFKAIKEHLEDPGSALLMTGDTQMSRSLHILLPKKTVFVLTPQILVNHLEPVNSGRPLLEGGVSNFTLFVFDECHHTREGEPYNNIMYYYLQMKRQGLHNQLPQVVGLTASISVEKADNMQEAKQSILNVCGNLDTNILKIVKRNGAELQSIVPKPRELPSVQLVERAKDEVISKMINIMQTLEKRATEYAQEVRDFEISSILSKKPDNRKLPGYCQWTVELGRVAMETPRDNKAKEVLMAIRSIIMIADYLKAYHFGLESCDLVQLEDVMKFLDRCFKNFQENEYRDMHDEVFLTFFTDLKEVVNRRYLEANCNLEMLASLLREYVCQKDDGRAIVFVRTRMLAESVSAWLNRCGVDDLMALHARKFTSTNAPECMGGMLGSQQQEVLDKFRRGEVRVLVATVGDEGLDIPQCNLIVKYNVSGNEVKIVQTRGRSRAIDGLSILLGMENILLQERENQMRIQLMEDAIENISNMSMDEMRQFVEKYQAIMYAIWDEKKAEEERRRLRMINVPFTVGCSLCSGVNVDSSNIRTIYGKYRVSIDRHLLDNIRLIPSPEQEMDQLKFVGTAYCLGETRGGGLCHNPIGTMIKHRKCPFVTMAIKRVKFQAGAERPQTYKQWKKVPYFVEEMSEGDLRSYAREIFDPQE